MCNYLIVSVLVIFAIGYSVEADFKRVCYYTIRPTNLKVNRINGTLCTHLLVGFASTVNETLMPFQDNDTVVYKQAVKLKKQYPHLTVMLSVGGGGNDDGFHAAVASDESRQSFLNSSLDLLETYGFDGLDIDWEFPGWQKHIEDRDKFIDLLHLMYDAFKNRTRQLTLSVAVAPAYTIIKAAYDITEMHKYVDFINLMAYDFHDYSEIFPFTAYNAPLYRRSSEEGTFEFKKTNVFNIR